MMGIVNGYPWLTPYGTTVCASEISPCAAGTIKDSILSAIRQIARMRGEFVDVGEKRLYYYAAGSRGAGDPVVLLHGFPTSSRLWHALVPDFAPGHRLVIVDLPGFGRRFAPVCLKRLTNIVRGHLAGFGALQYRADGVKPLRENRRGCSRRARRRLILGQAAPAIQPAGKNRRIDR